MADEASNASSASVLSTFDKLKLSSSNNSYSINNRNVTANIHTLIDKTSQSMVDVTSASAAASIFPVVVAFGSTNNSSVSVYEKSIDSNQLPKTEINFGSVERKTSFTKSGCRSVHEKRRDSGCSQFPSTQSSPIINDKTIQILCETSTDSVTESLTPPLLQSLTVSSSNSSSLSSIEMLLSKKSSNNKAGNFEMFSSSSNTKTVQKKVNPIETNEISIKLLKTSKCKSSSLPVSSSSPVVSQTANALAVQINLKCSSLTNICGPPPKVPPYNNKNDSCKKSNPKAKNQNFGLPLLPGRLTTNSLDNKKKMQSTSSLEYTTNKKDKKKRCSDRYDSSESSDSGVATSLSCTDSSTTSSDVSDPGSPYNPVLLGDELGQKSIIMPPQTILATTNGNAGKSPTASAATPIQNVLKGNKQQQKRSEIKNQQQQKLTKSQLPSPIQKVNQHIWPWTTLNGGVGTETDITSELASSPKANITTSNNNKHSNKRHSQISSIPIDGGAKKTRTINGNSRESSNGAGGVNANGIALQPSQTASNNKRLKVAAMEESQTKITGYFKSQMKAQVHQSGLKKDNTLSNILPSSSTISSLSPAVTVTAVVSSSSSSNNTVSAVETPSCSLNNYFNLLSSHMREEQERTATNAPSKLPSLPPALKKIERSRPTKIAQVAPNLRKTTAAPPLSHFAEKSPKKHVAIAPRTADTRQRHELSVTSSQKASKTAAQQQQPAVLLTAIHIPQSSQPPQLVSTSPRQQQLTAGKAPSNSTSPSSKMSTGPSLYQIPMMPNLVQFPNLIAANVSQLTGARGNHHPHAATSAQYFLNGTVFKLQQYTPSPTPTGTPNASFSMDSGNQSINTATMTNSTTAMEQQSHASINKNTSSITATSLQEMLSNQFQTQQQQQQSVSAHNHRLHHSQPVFMATTTGLLLNAASLPAMLAGTGKQTVAIQPQQIPALQPIQGAVMPGLSSIFSPHQEQQMQQYKSEQAALLDPSIPPLHQQTNIPPLAVSSSAFSKLAIVKAGNATFTPSVHQVSATQPPPLVTISSGSPIVSGCASKPHIPAKPYQVNGGQQESVSKAKRTISDSTNKVWFDSAPLILAAPSINTPPKSPPALIYPSLIAKKEEQHTNEDIFDILKNSKNETTLNTPPSKHYQSNEEKSQVKKEEDDISNTICVESSSLLSTENSSNTTISEESIKDSPPSPPEYSVTSSSLISVESPRLEIHEKIEESETPMHIIETSSSDTSSVISKLSPTVDIALADNDSLPKCAISPILSQPKTIRFPAKHGCGHRFGPKGMRRHDGVCYWDKCNKKHDSNSKLLDHMQTHHVNTQTGPFACLWLGCKVYGRESCSRRWLERHVLSHGGTKPFKCIVDGCGLRFGSQLALQKHVNGHFTATESKDSTSKRTSDPPVPKLLRKNGKKLRYRRQPFSARMFDFFDTGIMEGLHHRLRQISTLTNGKNCIIFRGGVTMRRKKPNGSSECFVEWAPPNIISNEWLPESAMPYIKTLPINRMQPKEKTNVESLLKSAYRLAHSPNLFQSFHSLSRQNSQDSTSTNIYSQSSTTTEDTADDTSRSSTFAPSSLSSVSNLPLKFPQIELRQKQSRKQPKTIQPS